MHNFNKNFLTNFVNNQTDSCWGKYQNLPNKTEGAKIIFKKKKKTKTAAIFIMKQYAEISIFIVYLYWTRLNERNIFIFIFLVI